jgi:glycine/D-amino acid oxidase-like deaminating enzyme
MFRWSAGRQQPEVSISMRIIIIGGGILGTAHAVEAIHRGHDVVHLERESEARGATVRNFGLIWVSGRAHPELHVTLRSRELWAHLAERVPGIGFRGAGSITVLRTPAEVAVAEEVAARVDAPDRGFTLLGPDRVRAINPALRGEFLAGLHCTADAAVESRQALPAIRSYLAGSGRYTFLPGTEARSVDGRSVLDDHDRHHHGDLVLV